MSGLKDQCCGTKSKPKAKTKFFDFIKEKNPIEDEIKDSVEVRKFFEIYPFIPYSGDRHMPEDGLLNFFDKMRILSPTHGSCIESLKRYCFGGKIEITRKSSEFDVNIQGEISENDKAMYIDFIKSIEIPKRYDELSADILDMYKTNGNCFAVLSLIETMGEKTSKIEFHEAKNVRFIEGDNERFVAISKKFDHSYLKDNKPKIIPIYPFYSEEIKGVKQTVFHLKAGNKIYGRPDSINSFLHQYSEFQSPLYLTKQTDNGFTGKVLMEFEAENHETHSLIDKGDFDSTYDRLAENFTQQGSDPMSIMMTERPYGTKPVFVHEFKPNTNENYYQVTSDVAELKIIGSHQWSKKLLGDSKNNGISGTGFMDELNSKLPVIEYYQNIIANYINEIHGVVAKWYGLPYEDYGIKFKSPIKMIANDNSVGSGANVTGQE